MQKRDMGLPRRAGIDAETQGVILWKTEIVRSSFVHEGEPADEEACQVYAGTTFSVACSLCRIRERSFIPIIAA